MNDRVTLQSLYQALQKDMIARAEFSSTLKHVVDKGDNAEENWLSWFKNYLPKRYKIAKATVIDSKGNVSDQIDIVIYDGQYSYLAFNQNGILYIPAESVYAVFEVKQNLNKSHMDYAGNKAASVRKLERTSVAIPHAGGVHPPKPLHHILAGILTTSSDWNPPLNNSFKKNISGYTESNQIDCGCVLNGGAFYYDYEHNELKISKPDESLIYFFLQLLILLQRLGTVPAIDLEAYMMALTITKEKI